MVFISQCLLKGWEAGEKLVLHSERNLNFCYLELHRMELN